MTLSLAEKTLLLLYGTDSQEPAHTPGDTLEASLAREAMTSQVIGAWLMELLMQGQLRLKRPALFVQCRWCYLLLVLAMLSLGLAGIFGPIAAGAAGVMSQGVVLATALGCLLVWFPGMFLLAHLISGQLIIEEPLVQDETLSLVVQWLREIGHTKTCQAYFRHLTRLGKLPKQLEKMQAHLVEQGYVLTHELSGSVLGTSLRLLRMNLNHPECRELHEHLRAFLLTGSVPENHIVALTILLSPRMLPGRRRSWSQQGLSSCFTPDEYPVLRARLKAIKAQQEQALQVQPGVTPYCALLTIRNLLPD
jgi:hypothetical protein